MNIYQSRFRFAVLWLCGSLCAVCGVGGFGGGVATAQQLIDIKADLVYPHKVNDTLSVLCLVGDFAAQHNGAVITADSAVRYSDDRLECFGNVLINKNTTYAYADRADYDGERNIASLFSPLIKVVDQDVTMYTYNFEFNTLDNVGRYWGGGMMRRKFQDSDMADGADGSAAPVQEQFLHNHDGEIIVNTKDDIMVSQRGYFISDRDEIVGVDGVEAMGEGYLMTGDSVIYNSATERIHFFSNTNIWSNEQDYIYGDLGSYEKLEKRYNIERNGYMLRPEQEMWSDTMSYYSDRNIAILYQDIQLDDTKNKSIAFGDYGQYWGDEERILLTRNPTLMNYDKGSTQSEPLYLRGDTILALSYALGTGPMGSDRAQGFDTSMFDALDNYHSTTTSPEDPDGLPEGAEGAEGAEDLSGGMTDDLSGDSLPPRDSSLLLSPKVSYSREELREQRREARYNKKDSQEALRIARQRALDTRAAAKEQAKIDARAASSAAKLRISRIKDYRKLMEREQRLGSKIAERTAQGRSIYTDSMFLQSVISDKLELAHHIERDSLIAWEGLERWGADANDSIYRDAMGREYLIERIAVDTPASGAAADSLGADADDAAAGSAADAAADSTYRVVVAFHNVRAFNRDFQMVSDSLVMESVDSTLRLFVKPVVWSEQHQMSAEAMDVYLRDDQLDYADLIDKPVMSSQVRDNDSTYFNQVTGKTMRISFVDNEVSRNDVDGNVETLYFMTDDNNKDDVTTVTQIESGDATFYIEDRELRGATYRTQPTYIFAPMDKRPSEVPLYLRDFAWYSSRRPELTDVLNRPIRPSRRDSVEALPRPSFRTATKIDTERLQLQRGGTWVDRTDPVSAGSTRWMESLGYTPGAPRE